MKTLLTNFALGWDINVENLTQLKEDLEKLGAVDLKFYESKFSLWSTLLSFRSKIVHSEPSEAEKSNHVDVLLNGNVVAQFMRRIQGFSGVLHEENIPENLREQTEDLLSTHGYYTGKTAWKHARMLPLLSLTGIVLSFVISFLALCLILFSPHDSMTLFLNSLLIVIGITLGCMWIYYYRKIFSLD